MSQKPNRAYTLIPGNNGLIAHVPSTVNGVEDMKGNEEKENVGNEEYEMKGIKENEVKNVKGIEVRDMVLNGVEDKRVEKLKEEEKVEE